MLPALPQSPQKESGNEGQVKEQHALLPVQEFEELPQVESEVKALWVAEKEYIERVIKICATNIPKAAALLDVSPSTLYRKIKGWEENL